LQVRRESIISFCILCITLSPWAAAFTVLKANTWLLNWSGAVNKFKHMVLAKAIY
jgi:hypothetical protein